MCPHPKVKFITTRRGGVLLLHDGRRFHRRKIYKDGSSFWLCYTKRECKGSIKLSIKNEILKTNGHDNDCCKDENKNVFLEKMDKLKQVTSSNFEPIEKQYNNMVCEMKDDGFHLLYDIPSFKNIKTGLYNERNKIVGAPKLRYNYSECCEVVIPQKFKDFILADYLDDDNTRIIIFCCKDIKDDLKNYSHIFADGTFKSCPSSFKQLYTIHGFNDSNGTIVPLFFCLLPNKKMTTYATLYRLIKSQTGEVFNPQKITLDYELAAIIAVQQVFPNIIVKGCYFHFNRGIFRRAKKMKTRVKQRHAARCVGLARLPENHIQRGYEYVMKRSPKGDDIVRFNKYFKKQWYNQRAFDFAKTCGCQTEMIRTTNHLEGWHNKINRNIGTRKPNIGKLLDVLERETKIYNINTSFKKSRKNKNYTEIEEEINTAINELKENLITTGHCLEIICPYTFI